MDVVEPAVVVTSGVSGQRVSLRHRLEFVGLRLALALARRLSVERVASLGAVLMSLAGPRLRQHRRVLANLAIAFPDRPAQANEAIARAMWANMGRTFAEALVLERVIGDDARFDFPELDLWRQKSDAAELLLPCTLHQGNWELIARVLLAFGRKPTGVYKPLDNPLVDAWLQASRASIYTGGLLGKGDREDTDTGHQTARQLIERARAGTLCFVADHFDRRGEAIPFMGRRARFTAIPATIARHVGATVWVGRCLRIGTSSRFRLELREVAVPRTGDRRQDGLALTTAMFAVFEDWARDAPEQWMWWNTRWVEPAAEAAPMPVPQRSK